MEGIWSNRLKGWKESDRTKLRLHADKVEYNSMKSRKQLLGDHVFVLYHDATRDDDVAMADDVRYSHQITLSGTQISFSFTD